MCRILPTLVDGGRPQPPPQLSFTTAQAILTTIHNRVKCRNNTFLYKYQMHHYDLAHSSYIVDLEPQVLCVAS